MKQKEESELIRQSSQFALDIIQTLNQLKKSDSNQILVRQCIRSGTSVGANIEEANGASSKKDFTHCLVIARKEARETRYWLRLLLATNTEHKIEIEELGNTATSLVKLINKINSTSKKS